MSFTYRNYFRFQPFMNPNLWYVPPLVADVRVCAKPCVIEFGVEIMTFFMLGYNCLKVNKDGVDVPPNVSL